MQLSLSVRRLTLPKFFRACCLSLAGLLTFSQVAAAANQPPIISGTPGSWVYVGSRYTFKPGARDPEGKKLSFTIANKPAWATFDKATGYLSGKPTTVGFWTGIKISVSDGTNTASLPLFSIRGRSPSNVAPTISGTPAKTAKVGVAYSFQPTAKDSNGDPLVYQIANKPGWASFSTSTGKLSGTPKSSHVGTYSNITISVTDGALTAKLAAFSITVSGSSTSNRAPTISGTPAKTATVGTAYSFSPTASDADGDSLGFSITNKPGWAAFSTSTGKLSGTPSATGTHSNIVISVSDGKVKTSLPAFSITVSSGSTTNTPPKISGSPATSATVGMAYSFKPTASDANGDSLTFSIANRPSWASFNTSTGQLSGTPSSSHAGTYSNVVISVSDGKANVSLPAFSISVTQSQPRNATLSWTAPTRNSDGTTLTNLAGYRIHYGSSPSVLSQTIDIANAGITSYVIEGLTAGTYYFAVKAYNSNGNESDLSNVVSKTVQ